MSDSVSRAIASASHGHSHGSDIAGTEAMDKLVTKQTVVVPEIATELPDPQTLPGPSAGRLLRACFGAPERAVTTVVAGKPRGECASAVWCD
jgi:hypothetical protein